MTWLVLRRTRESLLLIAALTGVLLVAFVLGRWRTVAELSDGGLPEACFAEVTDDCQRQASTIVKQVAGGEGFSALGSFWGFGHFALYLLPLVVGLLAGAGLFSRELDRGTHLLVLTQGVPRGRWWSGGLAVAVVPPLVAVASVDLVANWAFAPLDALVLPQPALTSPVFETSGVVPLGYTVLAFCLAAVVGLLTRSAAVAVIVTAVVFMVVMVALSSGARANYLPPETVRATVPAEAGNLWSPVDLNADWPLGNRYFDADGDPVPPLALGDEQIYDCRPGERTCLRAAGVVTMETDHHPADRYWPLQLIEVAILLALSAAAVAVGSVRLNRAVHA